ncbi:ABC1 kinase family protein [Candidatus Amarobacter glycogenicus]|uniref:ABC1 kinase family protein n=1 Tax=Candidatus Amarobacter glycogenicus TaxID=3140699 RepID=UPI00313729C2|nr:ABC1 kinase family protein [Dehalococcoidia bacterium]MBK8558579.1 ABC1 kinase family protein [Dehalococcoidia bacterium]
MAKSLTGSKPLPPHQRVKRFLDVGWTFLVIYLTYKRIQRNKKLTPAQRERRLSQAHTKNAERIYGLATRLEGMLIKTCQFISSRADVAPTEYIAVLSRLQDSVPARPYSQVVAVIRGEFGKHPDELFDGFTRAPIASASLAQVHRARTKDGHDVAVKVQYPGIDRILETDLRNIAILVKILARIEKNFDFRIMMRELNKDMPRELDFELEGRSSERVAKDLAHRHDIRIPKVHWAETRRRVLTTEFIEATKISDIEALLAEGIDPNQVALIMTEAYCEQILVHGFFHADPHPGNLFVLPGPVVVFLDFGLSKELPESFRLNYAKLITALIAQDNERMVSAFRAIGFKTKSDDPESLVALGQSFFDYGGMDNKPYVDADVMPEVNERLSRILQANPVTEIPGDILLIFRVLGLMSGLQKRLDSRVDMVGTITPYAEEQAQKLLEMTQGDAAG